MYKQNVPAISDIGAIVDFDEDNANSRSFNLNIKLTDKSGDGGTKNVEIMVPLKYIINFWRTL